jgi:hypothetical protein
LVNDAPAQRIRREPFALIIDDSERRLGELVDVPVRAPANDPPPKRRLTVDGSFWDGERDAAWQKRKDCLQVLFRAGSMGGALHDPF